MKINMEYKTRGRGNPLTQEEIKRVLELYPVLKTKAAVGRAIGRSPFSVATVLGTNSKQNQKRRTVSSDVFTWKDYNNSIIL